MQFRCNEPTIAFEILDDDVIVINLESGIYYSIVECGADIWSALVGGMTVEAITERLSASATAGGDQVKAEIDRFVDELIKEQLIVSVDNVVPASTEQNLVFKAPFTPPQLQKFTDMQELILLDPIHEVAEEGWPVLDGEKT